MRLPYGKRTGVPAVDRLTVVAHERFQDIVDEANRPDSIVKKVVVIGRDVAAERKEAVTVEPSILTVIRADGAAGGGSAAPAFTTRAERAVAETTLEVGRGFESLPSSSELRKPEVKERLIREVRAAFTTGTDGQVPLEGFENEPDIPSIVEKTVELLVERTIDIPRIVVQPKGEVTTGFSNFDLDTSSVSLQPVDQNILIHHLRTNQREWIRAAAAGYAESRPEAYLVRRLIDFDDVSYDDHADLLYELAGQMVAHLRSYLPGEDAILNVLRYHERTLAGHIHAQMQAHAWEHAAEYETTVSKGFTTLKAATYATPAGEAPRDFRQPVDDKQYIRNVLFGGFQRCLFPAQKFDSDTERRFAVLLENEPDASLKWLKAPARQFQLYYGHDRMYEPDFVVETTDRKYLCEPKMRNEMADELVRTKARAAVAWCERATAHELAHGGKPWSYLLIPHDAITDAATLAGLAASHTVRPANVPQNV